MKTVLITIHSVVKERLIRGHEASIDHDTERDKEVDESVHDEQLDHVCERVPPRRALPVVDELGTLPLHVVLA